jgi:hypothetical protein
MCSGGSELACWAGVQRISGSMLSDVTILLLLHKLPEREGERDREWPRPPPPSPTQHTACRFCNSNTAHHSRIRSKNCRLGEANVSFKTIQVFWVPASLVRCKNKTRIRFTLNTVYLVDCGLLYKQASTPWTPFPYSGASTIIIYVNRICGP